MSEYQYVVENSGVIKNTPESETGPQKAQVDPSAILNAPQGPGQSTVRAQAITQLQKSHGNQHVQRVVSGINNEQHMEELAREVDNRRGYGQPITEKTRGKMETALSQDFSNVKVHTDNKADQLSREFGARAFTTGQDIFFRSGAYDPGSNSGDKLLAHELTHVVQQGNSPAHLSGNKMNVSKPGDSGEQEANQISESLNSGSNVGREEENIQNTLQLQEEDETTSLYSEEEEESPVQAQPEDEMPVQKQNEALEEEPPVQAQPEDEIQEEESNAPPEEEEVNPVPEEDKIPEQEEEMVNPQPEEDETQR